MSFRTWFRLLSLWVKKARQHLDSSTFGMLILNTAKVSRLRSLLLKLLETGLEDVDKILDEISTEFKWTSSGEGYMHYKAFIRRMKTGKPRDGMEEFLRKYEHLYEKFVECVMPGQDLPSELKAYILLDACNLGDDQKDLLLGLASPDHAPPKYDPLKAKIRRTFGREAAGVKSGHGGGTGLLVVDEGREDENDHDDHDVYEEEEEAGAVPEPDGGEVFVGDDGREYYVGPDGNGATTIFVATKQGGSGKKGAKRNWVPFKKGPGLGGGGGPGGTKGGKTKGRGKGKRSGPSAQNPCRYCGEPDHWGDECSNPPEWAKKEIEERKEARARKGGGKTGVIKIATAATVAGAAITTAGGQCLHGCRHGGHMSSTPRGPAGGRGTTPQQTHRGKLTGNLQCPTSLRSFESIGTVVDVRIAYGDAPKSAQGAAAREAIVDNGAGDQVMGLATYKNWVRGETQPKRLPCQKVFRFGEGRVVRGLFRAMIPAWWAGRKSYIDVNVVPGNLSFLLGDPYLLQKWGVLDYWSVPGKPALTVNAPGDARVRSPLRRTQVDHWAIDLGKDAVGAELLCRTESGILAEKPPSGGDWADNVGANVALASSVTAPEDQSALETPSGNNGGMDASHLASELRSLLSSTAGQVRTLAGMMTGLVRKVRAHDQNLSQPFDARPLSEFAPGVAAEASVPSSGSSSETLAVGVADPVHMKVVAGNGPTGFPGEPATASADALGKPKDQLPKSLRLQLRGSLHSASFDTFSAQELWGPLPEREAMDFLETWAGTGLLSEKVDSALCRKLRGAERVGHPVDRRSGKIHDVHANNTRDAITRRLRDGGVRLLWMSPDAQWGMSDRATKNDARRLQGAKDESLCQEWISLQLGHGNLFVKEAPWDFSGWRKPWVKNLLKKNGVSLVRRDLCEDRLEVLPQDGDPRTTWRGPAGHPEKLPHGIIPRHRAPIGLLTNIPDAEKLLGNRCGGGDMHTCP